MNLRITISTTIFSAVFALATETTAQTYLSEIIVQVEHQEGELKDLVSELESNTGFTFAYLDQSLQNKPISLHEPSWQMDNLLKEVSSQARISVKRVGGSIAVAVAAEDKDFPQFVEEVEYTWSISGSVISEHDTALPYANVQLLNPVDSSRVRGVATNAKGEYAFFNIDPGDYIVQSSRVGFNSGFSPVFQVEDKHIAIDPIQLSESIVELKEVIVEPDKPLFEQRMDRLIVNVANNPTMAGYDAKKVLEKLPGVSFGVANNCISMNEKGGIMIKINDKPTNMNGNDLWAYLGSFPTERLEKIELKNVPSAKDDAEGNAGIINIVLKEDDEMGMNGSVNIMAGHGKRPKFMTSANFNRVTQKHYFFSSLSFTRDLQQLNHHYSREFKGLEELLSSTNSLKRIGGSDQMTARMGVHYDVSPGTTLSVSGDLLIRDYKAHMYGRSYYNFEPGIDTVTNSIRRNKDMRVQSHFNFGLEHQIDSRQKIEINLDYLDFVRNKNDQYDNEYIPQDGEDLLTEDLLVRNNYPARVLTGTLDYQLLIGQNTVIQTGIKATSNKLRNDVNTEKLADHEFETYPLFTFFSDMDEVIMATYGSIETTLGKTTFRSGLRYEHTSTSIADGSELPVVNRSYGSLFPSIILSRPLNGKSSVNVSYVSRISRPTFNMLSFGQKFKEPRIFSSGNTLLLPARVQTFQLSCTWRNLIPSIEYSKIHNDIANLPIHMEDSDFYILSNSNFGRSELIGIRMTMSAIFTDWWEMNNHFGFVHKQVTTSLKSRGFKRSLNYALAKSIHSFKLGDHFSAEILGSYYSGYLDGFRTRGPWGDLSVGLTKEFTNHRGKLSFNISDILNTNNNVTEITLPHSNLTHRSTGDLDKRIFRITYTNTFGNSKIKSRSKRKGGAEDELKRL